MKKTILLVAVCIFYISDHLMSQNMSGLEIMKKNDAHFDVSTEAGLMTMELINNKGKKRIRTVQRNTKRDKQRNVQLLIRFESPADVKGSGFLSIEHSKDSESRYLYLPALKKARRLSAGEDKDNFMGSDFTYEDLDDIDFDKYTFKNIGSAKIGQIDCFQVEVIPTATTIKNSAYSKRIYYIAKSNYVAHKIDFYDKHDAQFKTLSYEDIKEIQGGKFRAYKMIMKNTKTDHQTNLIYQNIKINEPIDDNFFTVRNLERSN